MTTITGSKKQEQIEEEVQEVKIEEDQTLLDMSHTSNIVWVWSMGEISKCEMQPIGKIQNQSLKWSVTTPSTGMQMETGIWSVEERS